MITVLLILLVGSIIISSYLGYQLTKTRISEEIYIEKYYYAINKAIDLLTPQQQNDFLDKINRKFGE